jgi:threonylcarbamoyladenosine tRNA methylthiotransferase MtaB
VFPFSKRKDTPAANLPNKVPVSEIKSRSKEMRDLGNKIKLTFYQKFIGQAVEVLVESTRDRHTGYLKGLTSNYLTVLLDGPDTLKNTMVHAKILKMSNTMKMIGKVNGK